MGRFDSVVIVGLMYEAWVFLLCFSPVEDSPDFGEVVWWQVCLQAPLNALKFARHDMVRKYLSYVESNGLSV